MPQWNVSCYPEGTTPEEFHKLLDLRREALAEATREHALGSPLPVQWRIGWRGYIRVQGRDRDGSLMAHIVVTGARGELPYVRKVRLVASKPLPRGLTLE
jgi:hypothetical protein